MKTEAQALIEAAIAIPDGYEERDLGDGYLYLIHKSSGTGSALCRFCKSPHEGTVSYGVSHWNSCAPYVAYVRARGCLGMGHEAALGVAGMVSLDLVPRHRLKEAILGRVASVKRQRKASHELRNGTLRELNECRTALVNEFLPADLDDSLKAQDLRREDCIPFSPQDLSFAGSWYCETSPTGRCVYHPASDPGDHDNCLYCRQPLERK